MYEVDDAVRFLHDLLDDGVRPTTAVIATARECGISLATLRRAKKRGQVGCMKLAGDHGIWVWGLPHHIRAARRARYQR